MILAVYGMFATGKTYAMVNYKDRLADACNDEYGLTIVLADTNTLYEYDKQQDVWLQSRGYKPEWKGKQLEKCDNLQAMIGDRSRLWVVESARYFGGMQDYIVDAVRANGGGIAFMVPTVNVTVGRKFLKARAAKINKQYRADYWTDRRLEYECRDRYINVMLKHYHPAGISYWEVAVDYERTVWPVAMDVMEIIAAWSIKEWYNKPIRSNNASKSSPNKRIERQRQDNDSQAADSAIQRYPLTKRFNK